VFGSLSFDFEIFFEQIFTTLPVFILNAFLEVSAKYIDGVCTENFGMFSHRDKYLRLRWKRLAALTDLTVMSTVILTVFLALFANNIEIYTYDSEKQRFMVTAGGTFGLPTINDRSEDTAEHTIKILNISKDENGCSKFLPLFPLRETSSEFLNEDRFRKVLVWDRSTRSRFNVMFVCNWLVSENPKYLLDFYKLDTRPVWENVKDLKREM
jgi:hypothetical protein